MARRSDVPRGYGVLLTAGLVVGFALGVILGEPSLGTVVGLAAGAVLALFLAWRRG
jgi:uncharacterized membrane protein YccC